MPRRSSGGVACTVCALVIVCIVLALLGIVGLSLAIWQTVDTLHTNHDLMQLALLAVADFSLVNAFYIFIAFTLLSTCCGGLGNRTKRNDGTTTFVTCCGVITTAIMISGYLASGILANNYKTKSLPSLRWGMNELLYNKTYIYRGSSVDAPEYTDVGKRFNYLQATRKCCGVEKPNGQDYTLAKYAHKYNISLPYSCCVLTEDEDIDPRTPTRGNVLNYDQCLKHHPDFFFRETCLAVEHEWLNFKCNFLVGYNFTLATFGFLVVILLVVLHWCGN